MNKLFHALFLSLITLPTFNGLKAMDNGWTLLSYIAKAGLLYVVTQKTKVPWETSAIGAAIGSCSASLWYYRAKSKSVTHFKRGLLRSTRNIHQKLDSLPRAAIVYCGDNPIGCIPDYTGLRRPQNHLNLPNDEASLRRMLQELRYSEEHLNATNKIDNQIFLNVINPTAMTLGIRTAQIVSTLYSKKFKK